MARRFAAASLALVLAAAAARSGATGREPVDDADPLIGTSNSRWMVSGDQWWSAPARPRE